MREKRWLNGVPERSHFLAAVIDAVEPVRTMLLSDLRRLFYETFGQMPGTYVRGEVEDAILYQAQADAYELAEKQMPDRVATLCKEAIDRAKTTGNAELAKKTALLEKLGGAASKKPTSAPKKKGVVSKKAAPKTKTPRKKRTADPIDDLAGILAGISGIPALVSLVKKLGLKDVDRYKKLAPGLARMTIGNRLRGFVRRGEISITKVKKTAKMVE